MNARRLCVCVAIVALLVLPGIVYGQSAQSALAGVVRTRRAGSCPA